MRGNIEEKASAKATEILNKKIYESESNSTRDGSAPADESHPYSLVRLLS